MVHCPSAPGQARGYTLCGLEKLFVFHTTADEDVTCPECLEAMSRRVVAHFGMHYALPRQGRTFNMDCLDTACGTEAPRERCTTSVVPGVVTCPDCLNWMKQAGTKYRL